MSPRDRPRNCRTAIRPSRSGRPHRCPGRTTRPRPPGAWVRQPPQPGRWRDGTRRRDRRSRPARRCHRPRPAGPASCRRQSIPALGSACLASIARPQTAAGRTPIRWSGGTPTPRHAGRSLPAPRRNRCGRHRRCPPPATGLAVRGRPPTLRSPRCRRHQDLLARRAGSDPVQTGTGGQGPIQIAQDSWCVHRG